MGSLQAEEKQEMDDSGCIQDESPPGKRSENGRPGIQLLDLSDDVLLLILRFLTPRDLKALGYTCPRLGALILDRSLWLRVDARAQPWGRARLRWYLAHALHQGTRALLLAGYAQEPRECLSHVNQTREETEEAKLQAGSKDNGKEEDNNNQPDVDAEPDRPGRAHSARVIDAALGPNAQLFIDEQREGSPEAWAWPRPSDPLISDSTCPGPVFTLTPCALRQLADTCPALTSLALEHCNINCNTTSISQFPPTLKKLSLRGSKCYNLPLDRSFLFKIQDTLPGLEFLDVSSCEWMEPASLLPLSKLPALARLWARDCLRLTEFVAYASLATRYGFTSLQELDLRGSPVGDSEVSALGWLPRLARLWLSPARAAPPERPRRPDDSWEAQEPEYFKIKEPLECKESGGQCTESSHTWRADNQNGTNSTATQSPKSSTTNPTNAPSPSKAPPSNVPSSHSLTVLTLETPPNATSSNGSSPTKAPSQSNGTTSSPNGPSTSMASSPSPHKAPSPSNRANSRASSPSTASSLKGPSTSMASSPSPHKAPSPSNRASSRASSPNRPSTSRESSSSHSPRSSSSPSPSKSPKAPKRKRPPSPRPGPSKRRRDDDDDSDSSDDDNVPLKCLIKNQSVNEGASTSRNDPPEPEAAPAPEDREAEPRHHVLYVNVGQQLHAVYRLSLDSEHIVSFNRNSNIRRVNSRILLSPPGAHVDASSLITDSAIRRFGRADGEDINYVHIGPNGPYASAPGARPDRSSLTHLSVTGFRHITDRSLEHLATSAPHLQFLDFSETRVTDAGVAAFRSLRPDCEVRYSKYIEKDED